MDEEKDRRKAGRSRKREGRKNPESHDQATRGPATKLGTGLSLKTILIQTLHDSHPEISTYRLSRMTVDELLAKVIKEFDSSGVPFRPRVTFLKDACTRMILGIYIHPDSPEAHG